MLSLYCAYARTRTLGSGKQLVQKIRTFGSGERFYWREFVFVIISLPPLLATTTATIRSLRLVFGRTGDRNCWNYCQRVGHNLCLHYLTIFSQSKNMSRRRRNLQQSMDLQGVNVGEVKVEVEDESNVTVKERKGRGTRSKPAIKIEVEPEEEDNGESKYFSKVEEKVSVVKEEKRDESFEDVSLEANKLTKSKSKSSPSPSKKVKRENVKVEPPENWVQMLENIKVMRSDKTAAVDTMGCERTADLKQEPQVLSSYKIKLKMFCCISF